MKKASNFFSWNELLAKNWPPAHEKAHALMHTNKLSHTHARTHARTHGRTHTRWSEVSDNSFFSRKGQEKQKKQDKSRQMEKIAKDSHMGKKGKGVGGEKADAT